ncbi:hypothetical protein AMJ85_11675, partial [candidate division BRC1 bacterium SM23_51]
MKHNSRRQNIVSAIALCGVLCSAGAAFAAPTAAEIEDAVAAIADYDYGQSRKALLAVETLINETYGDTELRARIEKELVKMVESDATLAAKQFVCRKLWAIGTDASVPALAKMLVDPEGKIAEMACYALSNHPSPAAGTTLRGALSKAKGSGLVAVINLLGERRDAESAEPIAKLADSPNAAVADAAIAALGKIANDQAVQVLGNLTKSDDLRRRAAANHAYLQCAQELETRGKRTDAGRIYEQLAVAG